MYRENDALPGSIYRAGHLFCHLNFAAGLITYQHPFIAANSFCEQH
jgi:hypothetical protein